MLLTHLLPMISSSWAHTQTPSRQTEPPVHAPPSLHSSPGCTVDKCGEPETGGLLLFVLADFSIFIEPVPVVSGGEAWGSLLEMKNGASAMIGGELEIVVLFSCIGFSDENLAVLKCDGIFESPGFCDILSYWDGLTGAYCVRRSQLPSTARKSVRHIQTPKRQTDPLAQRSPDWQLWPGSETARMQLFLCRRRPDGHLHVPRWQ